MIRSVALTSVVFSALSLSAGYVEAKSPNIPKVVVVRIPQALVIRQFPQLRSDANVSDEEKIYGKAAKKKKQKSEFARSLPAPPLDPAKKKQEIPTPNELPFSEEAAGLITVFGGIPNAIKDFKKIAEHLENGPDRIDPLAREGESGQWDPDNLPFGAHRHHEDEKNDHNPFNDYLGAFDSGMSDGSGEASQDGGGSSQRDRDRIDWGAPGSGVSFTEWQGRSRDGVPLTIMETKRPEGSVTTIRRAGGESTSIWHPSSDTQQDNGTDSRTAMQTETFGETSDGGPYRAVETRWEDGTFMVEIYGINDDGSEVLLARGRGTIDDEADQPAPDDTGQGGGNDNCGWRPFQGCTKTWSTPRQVNPGPQNPDGTAGTIALGASQSPGWATDPVEEGTGQTGGGGWEPPPIGDPADPPETGPI